ncbi:MAG: DEAD/DEAH box helicase [Candidatus Hatepunaea meridiana]|nr:DEAD/DEAH box helicase [Candidatus Hatepunaea meridiana]
MSIDKFLKHIDRDRLFSEALKHHERLPAQPARYAVPASSVPDNIDRALKKSGIMKLYSHQAEAINLIRSGHHLVAITPTASGKSLLYNLPVIEKLANDKDAHALYIFPLKALEQDQSIKLNQLIKAAGLEKGVSSGIYDGDTPTNTRTKMRKSPPSILITNPDMMHLSLMSYHSSWESFIRGLKYVVLDELHIYRGIFGSNILHLLHRLDRLCKFYGTSPQFIATSATIAGAGELAQDLTGHPYRVIEESGAPISKRHFLFFNPIESYLTFALKLFATALSNGLKTIVFTKARRTTELLHRWMNEAYGNLTGKVSSYRAGFLPEERREIEQKLVSGELNGVISTSALELGIDIGGLDVCIMVGYPGTIATSWQRAGRVGRGDNPSCICLVAGQDQLDQYFMRNPADFFARPVEKAIVDKSNPFIAKPHLLCAANEVPIKLDDPLAKDSQSRQLIEELTTEGKLLLGASGDRWFSAQHRPQREVNVRTTGDVFSIELENSNFQLGTLSGRSVFSECHTGAVYLHRAEQYQVINLDTMAKRAIVRKTKVMYYTNPLFEKETEILEVLNEKPLPDTITFTASKAQKDGYPVGKVSLARLKVTEQLVGYQKRRVYGQELISQHDLDYPRNSYETIGLAIAVPDETAELAADSELHFRGGVHGVEHALLALSPLFALCDRNDMGGYSTVSHKDVGGPAVFMYDGHPGGIGLSARLFDVFGKLVERTLRLVDECPCDSGCPSCIHSPKCGHGNIPLDKDATILTLKILAGSIKLKKIGTNSKSNSINIKQKKTQEDINNLNINKSSTSPAGPIVIVPDAWQSDKSGVVFDLETQRGADEVGGWGNIKGMGLAWAVVYRFPQDEYLDFAEKDVDELVKILINADLVIGFNHLKFDYRVLRAYSGFNFHKLKNYDILAEVTKVLGHRLKLDQLASATLGVGKTADGLQSLQWWRNGQVQKVAEYCRQDVQVTRNLFFHILKHEYLLFEKKKIGLVRVPLKFSSNAFE